MDEAKVKAIREKFGTDILGAIMEGQAALMKKYDTYKLVTLSLDSPEKQKIIREYMWYVTEELGEAANCLRNKPWVKTPVQTDRHHFYEEIADSLHFFIELLMLLGLTPEDLFELYFRKHEVNEFRIKTEY